MSRTVTNGVGRPGENSLVTIMFFAGGVVFLDRFGITYLLPQIGSELKLDNSQLALLVSVTAVTWAISSLTFSVLSDRIGRKKPIIIASLVLFSLSVGLTGLAPNFGVMLLLRALLGFFEGPALPIIQSAVAGVSTPSRRGRNLGLVIAGSAVFGSALAPAVMIGIASATGWRAAFPVVAIPGFAISILVAIFYKERRTPAEATEPLRFREFASVVRSRNVLLAVVGTTLLIAYTIGFGTFSTQYLSDRGLSARELTLVLTTYGIAVALANVVTPTLSDRIGRKPALYVALICAAVVPVFFLLLADTIPLLMLALLVAVLGGGALTIFTYVVPAESVPSSLVATAFAVQIAFGETLGGALGPQIGGAIADVTGDLGNAMVLYAALPVVALFVAYFLKETAPRKVRSPAAPEMTALAEIAST